MPAIATTLRYRTYPSGTTPRGLTGSTATVEKEPERDPEAECFMCRQANVYLKPIGIQHERRVGSNQPPPLTREEIEELSQKKELNKKEVRKLLQCYFPEIKDVKYFQLHRYHSCCYDPKHLNLCKNHITALQSERERNPGHHHGEEEDTDFNGDGSKRNRVSFVRIKIEPTKGIPTRFLGPAALPESLADMLIKQVNSFEKKKRAQSVNSNHESQPQIVNESGYDDYDDGDAYVSDANLTSSRVMQPNQTTKKTGKRKKTKLKHWEILALEQANQQTCPCRHHVTRVEGDQLVHDWCRCKDHRHNGAMHEHHSEGPNGQPTPRELRLKLDQVTYDWCKCSSHRHAKTNERRKSITLPAVSRREAHTVNDHGSNEWCDCHDPRYKVGARKRQTGSFAAPDGAEQTQKVTAAATETGRGKGRGASKLMMSSATQHEESVHITPTPSSTRVVVRRTQYDDSTAAAPKTQVKRRETHTRTVATETKDSPTTEIALAYDPATDDYEIIQEAIYYRTSSGRLLKPQITNNYTYEDIVAAVNANRQAADENRPRRRTNTERPTSRSVILSNPGSVYRGQAYIDSEHGPRHTSNGNGIPVLKLPAIQESSRQQYNDNHSRYHPAEFTLAKFGNEEGEALPSQRATGAGSTGGWKTVQMSMQTSTKPTFTNTEPTPNFGQDSSVVANRRWFDQPLGDQNLHTVQDSEHGVIAAPATNSTYNKSQIESDPAKKENNCTIS